MYIGFAHCLQAECQYLLRCVSALGPFLAPIEAVINGKLIPALLSGMLERPSRNDFRCLVFNSVRFGEIVIRKPVEGTARTRVSHLQAGVVLKAFLLAGGWLNTTEHRWQVQSAAEPSREAREHEEELFR